MSRVSLLAILICGGCGLGQPAAAQFSEAPATVEVYEFVEISVSVSAPRPTNCFTDASFEGTFQSVTGPGHWRVARFCDLTTGTFRIRFMPSVPGGYRYPLNTHRERFAASSGTFSAVDAHRRGQSCRPAESVALCGREQEHYFFNGTTAYWLAGWEEESTIRSSIERYKRLSVNRLRVTLAGRTHVFYGEPVVAGDNWTPLISPWPASEPNDIYHPGFDYSRFRLAYWQKYERMLRFARDRDIVVSVVLDMNDSVVHPLAESENEHRFVRYAVARLASFSNVTWDLGDDLDLYRTDAWTRRTGTLVKQWDPTGTATSHPVDNRHQDRTSSWFLRPCRNKEDRTVHAHQRALQHGPAASFLKQTRNTDTRTITRCGPSGAESGDALRRRPGNRVAGGYVTSGETARRGTNIGWTPVAAG